jgi:prophage tail gpP-like protein
MPDADYQPTIELRFPLLGRTFRDVISYSLASNYMTSTDAWSVTFVPTSLDDVRDLEIQPIEIAINGNDQLVGRVDASEVGGKASAVTLRGRDMIADLVECHVDPTIKLKKEMTLAQMVALACGPAGITDVAYQDELVGTRNIRTGAAVGRYPVPDFKEAKLTDYKAKPGESCFAFCNRVLARHRATMQPGLARGQVILAKPDYVQKPFFRLRRSMTEPGDASNNVLSATATRDLSSYPTHVLVTSKTNKAGRKRTPTSANVSHGSGGGKPYTHENNLYPTPLARQLEQNLIAVGRRKPGGPPLNPPERLYRLQYVRDDDSKNQAQIDAAAFRLVADRLKASLRYDVTVRGHRDIDTGATWSIDTIVQVDDELCGINEPLWIEGRTFSYAPGQGPTTKLTCYRPGSFLL